MATAIATFASQCRRLVGNQSHLGLAVSGGVDSMAMALLARHALPETKLTSYTVDHGVREGSGKEAEQVTQCLRELGIDEVKILKMQDLATDKRFELEARMRRARLFQDAAQKRDGVGHLLLAHTKDDQVETFIMRLIMGSSARGLAGIRATNFAPVLTPPGEQPLIYARPLLEFAKADLRSICEDHNLQWFEDETNHDPQLTMRNAIRRLISTDSLLPNGMTVEQVHNYMDTLRTERDALEKLSTAAVHSMAADGSARFDGRLGVVTIEWDAFGKLDKRIQALVLLKAIEAIIPIEAHYYKLADLHKLLEHDITGKVTTVANLRFDCRTNDCVITRQRPYAQAPVAMSISLPENDNWSQWQLFDARIWIRARTRHSFLPDITITYPPNTALVRHELGLAGALPEQIFHVQPVVYADSLLLGCPSMAPCHEVDVEYSYKEPELQRT